VTPLTKGKKAQRAIRERAKSHIDRLNDRIRAYETSQPFRELQAANSQREAAERENEELRQKMAQAAALLHQPSSSSCLRRGSSSATVDMLGGGGGLQDLASACVHASPFALGPPPPPPPPPPPLAPLAPLAPQYAWSRATSADLPSATASAAVTVTAGGSLPPTSPQGAPPPPSPLSPLASFAPSAPPEPVVVDGGVGFALDAGNRFVRGPLEAWASPAPAPAPSSTFGATAGGDRHARLSKLLPRPNTATVPPPQQLPSPTSTHFFPSSSSSVAGGGSFPAPPLTPSSPPGASAPAPLPAPPPPHMLLPRSHVGPDIDAIMLGFLRDSQQSAAAALATARGPSERDAVMRALAGPESADYAKLASQQQQGASSGSSEWSSTASSTVSATSPSATAAAAAVLAGGPWPSAPSPAPAFGVGTGRTRKLARLFGDIMSTFPNVRVAERAATVYVMHRLMRWQLWPTKSTYDALPVWLRPSVAQIFVPHQHWLDYLVWYAVLS
jgi:hypothetical protein